MDVLEKAEVTNSEVPDTAGRETTRRKTQTIAKRFAFYANAKANTINLYVIN